MIFNVIVCSLLISHVAGHSWADNVAGGSYRGAQGATDLVKQRYFCPLPTLAECQPPAQTGVVLTAEALNSCRTDFPTPVWGNAVAGKPMYVHWAGNGHTGTKGAGTCVTIKIAPYAINPAFSAFRTLASCLPFSHDGDITDASVTLPSDLPAGDYTVFWGWDFAPFWFSSCSDIRVSAGSGSSTTKIPTTVPVTAKVTTTKPPTTPRSTITPISTSTTVRGSVPSSKPVGGSVPASTGDCKRYVKPNEQCSLQFGPSSYCVSWVQDKCGRSHCFGTTFDDSRC